MAVKTCKRCGEDNKESTLSCVVCGESLKHSETIGLKDKEKDYSNLHYEDVTKCRICRSENIEEGFEVNLCKECREKLVRRKIPTLIKLAAIIVFIIMAYSFTRLPAALNSGSTYYDGIEAYKSEDYSTALSNFMELRKKYPRSDEIAGWIGLTYMAEYKYDEALAEFNKIPEKSVFISWELEKELEELTAKFYSGEDIK